MLFRSIYVNWGNAANSWNGISSKVRFSSTGFGNERVYLTWYRRADEEYGYAVHYPSDTANPYTYATGHLNRYYTDGFSSNARRSVMAHELGHDLGFIHNSNGEVLMNPLRNREVTYVPTIDERLGLVYWYGA